jgi:hypothetical protein
MRQAGLCQEGELLENFRQFRVSQAIRAALPDTMIFQISRNLQPTINLLTCRLLFLVTPAKAVVQCGAPLDSAPDSISPACRVRRNDALDLVVKHFDSLLASTFVALHPLPRSTTRPRKQPAHPPASLCIDGLRGNHNSVR